jgi:sialic acid synthase SpsE
MEGPDHRASMEPDELIALVQAIRSVEIALGDGIKRPMPSEILNRKHMRKSLVANRNIGAGEVVHAGDLVCKRPGTGLEPFWMGKIVGQKTKKNIQKDELIDLSEIDWN